MWMVLQGRNLRFALGLVTGLALTTFEAPVRASPQTFVTLDYQIAPNTSGCPNADEFRASVGRQLGYDPFRPDADRRVAVQIEHEDAGFNGWIRWSDAGGHWVGDRRLSSQRADCSEIAANVAFAVAVEVQLMATFEPQGPRLPQPPATITPPAVTPAPAPAPSAVVPGRQNAVAPPGPEVRPSELVNRLKWSAGLGASLGFGLAPRPAGVGRVYVTSGLERFSLELAGDALLPVKQRETDGSGFSLDRFSIGAALCGDARAFAVCLTSAFGRLQAHGFGVDTPASPAGFFSQLGVRIAATYDFGDRFFASARIEPVVMLSRWAVLLNDRAVWTTPRVGALAGLDFGARIF